MVRRTKNIFSLMTWRSIKSSFARFIALVIIVALGCGFYAGLRMCGPVMRSEADLWYDSTNLWDLRLISTLGFSDEDIKTVSDIAGVDALMPSVSLDAIARLKTDQLTVRVSTLDMDAARDSKAYQRGTKKAVEVVSDDKDYLNRPVLIEGSWPDSDDECLASADAPVTKLKVGDTVELLSSSEDLDSLVKLKKFRVSGLVSSSQYPYTGSFGSSSLGSGHISQYIFIPDSALADECPYTELFISVKGAKDEMSESSAYFKRIDAVKKRLNNRKGVLAQGRRESLVEEARARLDEKRQEFDAQKADVTSQLDEAKASLDKSYAQLENGRAELNQAQAALTTQKENFESKKAQTYAKLNQAFAQLDDHQQQISDQGELLLGKQAELEAREQEAQEALKALGLVVDTIDATTLESIKALPLDDDTKAELISGLTSLIQAKEELVAAGRQLGEAKLQLSATYTELQSQKTQADAEFSRGKKELDAASAQIQASREELLNGQKDYEAGLAAYNTNKAEADQQFAKAEEDLKAAEKKIDEVELPDIYVLDRSQSEGAALYHSDTERIDSIARVFPFIFFLVAALVALTTMTRAVESDRILIGTFKALGYSAARIAGHYIAYAALASGLGAVIGIAALTQILPMIVTHAYGIIYVVPSFSFPLPVDFWIVFSSGALGIAITLVTTAFAVLASLKESPAALLQPRAPKPGKRILLERFSPLWTRLSFSWKVTCRNIFRYKGRLMMTVVGVAGCTALMLVGFGLHGAIWDIINKQFGDVQHFNTTIMLDESAESSDVKELLAYLKKNEFASDITRVESLNLQVTSRDHDKTYRLKTYVLNSADDIGAIADLRERTTQKKIRFSSNSVVLSEKTAQLLNIKKGDPIQIYKQDKIGNPRGEAYEFTVSDICENYVDNVAYIGSSAWEKTCPLEDLTYTTLLSKTDSDSSHERLEYSNKLYSFDHVSSVIFESEAIERYTGMLSAVNMIVVVLTAFAAALAFIVLYNLTNINIEERIREIATLKVLGFTRFEIGMYIFREVLMLALFGDLLGLGLGHWLENYVITTVEVEYIMFGRTIYFSSYFYSLILTMVFSAIVLLIMRHKLNRVDMVESLKSVD